MSVSIPCAGCRQPVEAGAGACRGCGWRLSGEERAALEARFGATNEEYREARSSVDRGLTMALVVGLLTLTFVGIRLVLEVSSPFGDMNVGQVVGVALQLLFGAVIAACYFVGKRLPVAAISVAAGFWLAALVLPFVSAPVSALFGVVSVTGALLTMGRIAVLFIFLRAVFAAFRMKRLYGGAS